MTSDEIIKSVADMPSYILEDDIRLYFQYVSKLKKDSIVLDIGTGLGKSAIALALSNPEVTVLTFDTGEYPLERNWIKSIDDYYDLIEKEKEKRGVENINFFIKDVLTETFLPNISLFHLDAEIGAEGEILEYIFPLLESGSIILVRNYKRFYQIVDRICKDCAYLEQQGQIQVIRKL